MTDTARLRDTIAALESKLRMIVSHATMGSTDGSGMSVNDICVQITAFRNDLYREAQAAALAATPQPAPEPVAWRVRVKSDDAEEWSLLPAGGGADYRDREGYECQPLYKNPPQPAPVDREALVRLLQIITRNGSLDDGRTLHEVIADALLARGLRLPSPDQGRDS